MKKLWWEAEPDRFAFEKSALEKAGIQFEIDEQAFKNGILLLHIKHHFNGQELFLDAIFPELYPYFRFEIKALNLDLMHHQNPFQKNLCLLGRATENWHPTDFLADFIIDRLPKVISTGLSTESALDLEEQQGEPVSTLYPCVIPFITLIDSSWNIDPSILKGYLSLGISEQLISVLEITDSNERRLITADERLTKLFRKRIKGQWVRMPKAVKESNPEAFKKEIKKTHPQLKSNFQNTKGILLADNVDVNITGVIFPDELAHRETKDGWIFLLEAKSLHIKKGFPTKNIKQTYFVRSGRAGRNDMNARIPEMQHLKNKKIALLGLGCLGAPSALEFARCGVGELRILDNDIIEPGTIVRWPLGMQEVGKLKTNSIASFIEASYPYTKVIKEPMRIGEVPLSRDGVPEQYENIENFLDGVDLIYDATAEVGIQYFLSSRAIAKKIPYICLSTTYGAWGGTIARVIPGSTGCWTCLKHWQMQHSINPAQGIPVPNSANDGIVQPKGCADPTFTGASFDGAYIALSGVRLAVSTLCRDIATGYPSFTWDVGIINLRDEQGNAIAPEWKIYKLNKYPECYCQRP